MVETSEVITNKSIAKILSNQTEILAKLHIIESEIKEIRDGDLTHEVHKMANIHKWIFWTAVLLCSLAITVFSVTIIADVRSLAYKDLFTLLGLGMSFSLLPLMLRGISAKTILVLYVILTLGFGVGGVIAFATSNTSSNTSDKANQPTGSLGFLKDNEDFDAQITNRTTAGSNNQSFPIDGDRVPVPELVKFNRNLR